jgi:hypothetical protein
MLKRITDPILKSLREETWKERSERMLPGAIIGIVAATAYVLVLSTINVITLPALHLSVDWISLLTNLVKYDLVLALVGAIAGWFTDDYMGAVGGGILSILLLLIYNWVVFLVKGGSTGRMVQLVVTSLPLLVGAMVLCGVFRFAINRYLRALQGEPANLRRRRLAGWLMIVFLVGLLPGVFSRFDQNAQKVILTMDERLQAVSSDATLLAQFPLAKFPALQGHFGMHFVLYPRASAYVPSALDVTIRYEDGYAVTCLVSTTDPYVQYFGSCYLGNEISLP